MKIKNIFHLIPVLFLLTSSMPLQASPMMGGSPTPFNGLPTSTPSIVTFGDSITVGQGASPSTLAWANQVATALGATLDNQGISGTILQNQNDATGFPRANNGRSRFATDLFGSHKKSMAFIDYGFNDMRYTAAPATLNLTNYKGDFTQVLNGMMLGGYNLDQVVLGTPYYMTPAGFAGDGTSPFDGSNDTINASYGAAVRDLAVEYGTFYCDPRADMIAGGGASLIGPDNIHPNNAGYAIITASMLSSKKVNPFTQIEGLTVSSPATQQLTVSYSAYPNAVSYEVQAGLTGTYNFPQTATPSGTTTTFTSLPLGSYVERVRAVLPDSQKTPWAFYTTPVSVSGNNIAVDGVSAVGACVSTCSVTLTTTHANDILIMMAAASGSSGAALTGITDSSGLTWTKRTSVTSGSGINSWEEWYAKASSIQTSDNITITANGNTTGTRIFAFGVSGANFTTPFDVNVALPGSNSVSPGTSTSVIASTTANNTMLILGLRSQAAYGTLTPPAGLTSINNSTATDISTKLLAAPITSVSEAYSWTNSVNTMLIVDAIQGP